MLARALFLWFLLYFSSRVFALHKPPARTVFLVGFEIYERVCGLEGVGELRQEALVNSGNALCEWASLATSIPEDKGGGAAVATELYKQADERCSI
jgi:hypothetical protein